MGDRIQSARLSHPEMTTLGDWGFPRGARVLVIGPVLIALRSQKTIRGEEPDPTDVQRERHPLPPRMRRRRRA